MVDYVKDFLLKKEDPYAKAVDAYINNPSMSSPIYMAQPEQPKVDLSNAINSAIKNWGAAMDVRNSLNTAKETQQEPQEVGEVETFDVNSLKPQQAPQEVNLKQAEQELQEAKEADKQSGSEGYEAKPDGIFDRLKGFGAAIIGKQGLQDWEDFKKDFGERGIGAVGQRANSLMEDMARSPFSKFVDPTTVLGGQRTMVNDIDSYFNQQGLPALRNELLAQDIARLKTPIGQAEEWAKKTPEQQAAMKPYFEMKGTGGYTGVGPKNWTQVAIQMAKDLEAKLGRKPTMDELDEASRLEYGVPYLEMAHFGDKQTQPKNLNQALIDEAESRFRDNPDLYDNNKMNAYREVFNEAANDPAIQEQLRRQGSYQPRTREEQNQVAADKKRSDKYIDNTETPILAKAGDAIADSLKAAAALRIVKAHPEYVGGGGWGANIRSFANNLGISNEQAQSLDVFLKSVYGTQMADILETQNVGSVSDSERKLFASQAVSLGDSPEGLIKKLALYILQNDLAQQSADFIANNKDFLALPDYEKDRAFVTWQNSRFNWVKQQIDSIMDGTHTLVKRGDRNAQ